jgi:cytochrome c oxidase cbb3-type subunit 2
MELRFNLLQTLCLLVLLPFFVACEPSGEAATERDKDQTETEPQAQAQAEDPAQAEEPTQADSPTPAEAQASRQSAGVDAAALYQQQCALCHMDDGSGVPDLQPPLAGSEIVTQESPDATIRSILLGSQAPEATGDWGNPMPGFGDFSDAQVAALATHVRTSFGNEASPVTVEDVARVRE